MGPDQSLRLRAVEARRRVLQAHAHALAICACGRVTAECEICGASVLAEMEEALRLAEEVRVEREAAEGPGWLLVFFVAMATAGLWVWAAIRD